MAQEKEYLAFIPTFHDRFNTSESESPLQLRSQRFVLFVYRNAVAVYSEAEFVNMGIDTIDQELALPSTGHLENEGEPDGRISNGILSVQLWLEGKEAVPELINDGREDWYTIRARFAPQEYREVNTLFWAQTSLTDVDSVPGLDTVAIAAGDRGFLIDLAHAAVWNDRIESIDITVMLKDSLSFERDAFSVEPDTYDLQGDSCLVWSLAALEPSMSDNILVLYTAVGNQSDATDTMTKLSAYIVGKGYDDLLSYGEGQEEE